MTVYEEFQRATILRRQGLRRGGAHPCPDRGEARREPGGRRAARPGLHSAQLGRAEAAFRRLGELDPSNGWAYEALARTLERRRRGAPRRPPVLMFDEPVNGLDPDGVRWVRELLRSLAAEGRTVFVSGDADHFFLVVMVVPASLQASNITAFERVADYMPGVAGAAFMRGESDAYPPVAGLLIFTACAVAAVAAAHTALNRRDA